MPTCSYCNDTGTMTATGLPCKGCGPPPPPLPPCPGCEGTVSLHTCQFPS